MVLYSWLLICIPNLITFGQLFITIIQLMSFLFKYSRSSLTLSITLLAHLAVSTVLLALAMCMHILEPGLVTLRTWPTEYLPQSSFFYPPPSLELQSPPVLSTGGTSIGDAV